MKHTILATGSNGLLGQKIIYAALINPELNLIATAIGANRTKEKSGYTYEELDITDEQRIDFLIEKYKPNTLINTAASTNVDLCETNREQAKLLNADAVGFMAKTCKKHNTHFIHLFTDFIFDGTQGPYDASVARRQACLRSFFRYCNREGICTHIPRSRFVRHGPGGSFLTSSRPNKSGRC